MMDNAAITPKKIALGLSLPKTCPNAPEFDCIDGLDCPQGQLIQGPWGMDLNNFPDGQPPGKMEMLIVSSFKL